MGGQNSGKGAKKWTLETKATIIAYRKAGMKLRRLSLALASNAKIITRVLAASRALRNKGIPQRKKGSERPRKVTKMVLKKYPS
jgi:hypothetical protein